MNGSGGERGQAQVVDKLNIAAGPLVFSLGDSVIRDQVTHREGR